MAQLHAMRSWTRQWFFGLSRPASRYHHIHKRPLSQISSAPSRIRGPGLQTCEDQFGLRVSLIRGIPSDPRRRLWSSRIGAEPGLDASFDSTESEPPIPQAETETEITIIDYSDKRIETRNLTSTSLPSFLSAHKSPPEWAACRWVYVNGLNWDVVKCLGSSNSLHRLAIEDVLDPSVPTGKVDWYDGHCYMEMTLQKLVRYHSPDHWRKGKTARDPPVRDQKTLNHWKQRWRTFSHGQYGTFGMSIEQVSAFLTADKTVITIFERSGNDVLTPILKRLESAQTILRSSNDPSMLVHAVIDVVVDLSLPIGKAANDAFGELEHAVFSTPTIAQSRQVYVLRSGLTSLMDNITATGGVVRTLIDHRAAPKDPTTGLHQHPNSVSISPLTQVYLEDVQDHVRTLSKSATMSIRSGDSLTSLIFNTIAANQNESVRQLTLVSCFFLPLTFLTGYFGMNFEPMPVVTEHSDAFFWVIATPIMFGTMLILVVRTRWYRSLAWFKSRRKRSTSTGK